MEQTREASAQQLAERRCWQAARRDDARVAWRLYRQPVVEGVDRLDQGAWLEAFCDCWHKLGVVDLLGHVQGPAVPRAMGPIVQYLLRYRLKPRCGMARMQAWPALLCSAEALMRLVGCKASQVRHGVGQRGAAKRQGPRTPGPMCPEALADTIVKLHRRDLEAFCNGVIRALAKAGVLAAQVTSLVEATDRNTTAQDEGCGPVTRQRKSTDTRGTVHELDVTVAGWKLIVVIAARTTIPWAATVVPIQAHETRSWRALVTPARTHRAGHARLHQVVFDRGVLDGTDVWWLDQRGRLLVVPATENMAVTVDAQAQAAAGAGGTVGRRAHTVRHRPGTTACTERLETEVVGSTGLTTDAQ
jgi:hypothetical protein